jgi:hypothetical protein
VSYGVRTMILPAPAGSGGSEVAIHGGLAPKRFHHREPARAHVGSTMQDYIKVMNRTPLAAGGTGKTRRRPACGGVSLAIGLFAASEVRCVSS